MNLTLFCYTQIQQLRIKHLKLNTSKDYIQLGHSKADYLNIFPSVVNYKLN